MLGLLRAIAKTDGEQIQSFLAEQPMMSRAQGVELSIDRYFMAYLWECHGDRADRSKYWWQSAGADYLDSARSRIDARWNEHARRGGYPNDARPIIITVVLRDEDSVHDAHEERDNWPTAFGRFPIRYEARPKCVALKSRRRGFSRRDSIGTREPNTAGTMGGVLHSRDQTYAVTCAHVIGESPEGTDVYSPGPRDSRPMIDWLLRRQPQAIGFVASSIMPPPHSGLSCNARTRTASESLDAALIRIQGSLAAEFQQSGFGHVDHASSIDEMPTSAAVTVRGWRSGQVSAELGDHSLWREVEVDGVPRCFGDVFTITPPHPWYTNAALLKPGDSGAWVAREFDGVTVWDGMVFACAGARAYVCYSQNILDWAQRFDPDIAI